MRRLLYISGSRADFGLMRKTLNTISLSDDFELSIIVTGSHLNNMHGMTITEIENEGFKIQSKIPTIYNSPRTGESMAQDIALIIQGIVKSMQVNKPDILILLGDRGEMLAAAIAAIHLNIPIVHIHGGERSGTVDEPIRHAISKLSHFHFVATEESKSRLIKMGEDLNRVFVTGAPGLDGIKDTVLIKKELLYSKFGFDPKKHLALFLFHPVHQEESRAENDANTILRSLDNNQLQVLAIQPNSDAGSDGVRLALEKKRNNLNLKVLPHIPRHEFISFMASSDLMIGNSSAGIIEASSFGLPVINVGLRQNLRERNKNVMDIPVDIDLLNESIKIQLSQRRYNNSNIFYREQTANRITQLLKQIPINPSVLLKINAY